MKTLILLLLFLDPVVPVEFMDIAYKNHELTWRTASELDNDYFTLEKSIDGKTWEHFARVQGSGTSKIIVRYHLEVDEDQAYYRLSQTDYDGTTKQLAVILVPGYKVISKEYYDLQGRPTTTTNPDIKLERTQTTEGVKWRKVR